MPQPLPTSESARSDAVSGPVATAAADSRDASATAPQLAQQLAACRAELARTQRDLELLSHGVSHDLRAPLRAIDAFSGLLEQHAGADLDDSARDHLARVRAASARMGALIDGLLALSRAARVPLQIADVDASLLAEWSLAELQDAEPTRAARSGVQPGMVVRADEQQLKLLFDQLLGNAWRFSRGRDEVRIEVSAAAAGDALRISVRDHGTGFDPALAAKVFEPFQRLHGTDEGGGHGLGLAIAQRIVERMGGVLAVDAVPGEGCTFHVELPRGSDSAGAVPPAGTPP